MMKKGFTMKKKRFYHDKKQQSLAWKKKVYDEKEKQFSARNAYRIL